MECRRREVFKCHQYKGEFKKDLPSWCKKYVYRGDYGLVVDGYPFRSLFEGQWLVGCSDYFDRLELMSTEEFFEEYELVDGYGEVLTDATL